MCVLALHSRLTPKKNTSHKNLPPTQFLNPTVILRCFALPTRARKKLLSNFYFAFLYSTFLFLPPPQGFLTLCLPADEATAKSVIKYSPTDSEKQTAVVCKDNGLFYLTKPLLCQKPSMLVKTPPMLRLLATLATVRV